MPLPLIGAGRALLRNQEERWVPDYLFRAEFAFPLDELGATYTEGNGTFNVTATGGAGQSKSDGKLVIAGPDVVGWDQEKLNAQDAISRSLAGVACVWHYLPPSSSPSRGVGFGNDGTTAFANYLGTYDHGSSLRLEANPDPDLGFVLARDGTEYYMAVVANSARGLYFIKGGDFSEWTLIWAQHDLNPSGDMYPTMGQYTAVDGATHDFLRVLQLPAPFNTEYGFATDRLAGAISNGTVYTHEADCVIEWEHTTVGTSTSQVEFRRQSSSDHWLVAVNSSGTLYLYERVGGTATNRGNTSAGVVVDGVRIVVTAEDETIRVYVDDVLQVDYSGAANFKTETAGKVSTAGTGGAISDLVAWPRTASGNAKAILDRVSAPGPEASYPLMLNVTFSTDGAAPMDSPYEGERGSVHIVDVGGSRVSVSGGELIVAGTGAWGDAGVYSDEVFDRAAGLALIQRVRWPSGIGHMMTGWTSGADANFSGYVYKGWSYDSDATALGARMDNSANSPWIHSIVTGDQYILANVLRSYGRLMFVKHSGVWRTVWVDEINNGTNLRAGYVAYTAGTPGHTDDFRVVQLPAPFDTEYGFATEAVEGAITTGQTITHEADFVLEYDVASMATSGTIRLDFRMQDASNNWRLVLWSAGDITLYEVVAGATTSRGYANPGMTDGKIYVIAEDETIRVYLDGVMQFEYTGAANFKTETDAEMYNVGGGASVSDLIAWPRFPSGAAAEILDGASGE